MPLKSARLTCPDCGCEPVKFGGGRRCPKCKCELVVDGETFRHPDPPRQSDPEPIDSRPPWIYTQNRGESRGTVRWRP